jgi:hypothetical protein
MLRKLIAAKIVLSIALLCSSAVCAQTPIDLTSSDRAQIWRSLGRDAMRTSIPAGLHVGEQVPGTMRLLTFGRHLRRRVPAIAHYVYALLQGQVLVVDRRARTIVSIVYE